MNLQFGRKSPINIVIQDHVIRFVETKGNDLHSVKQYGERYIQSGLIRDGKILDKQSVESILEECISEWKIKNRLVNFLVPESTILFRKLEIPNDIPNEEIKGYLYLEIGTSIHLPFEDPVFDFHLLGEVEDKKEILLFAAPDQAVTDYVNLFDRVHLQPTVADISPLAIYRIFHHLQLSTGNEHILFIDYNIGSISLSIFNEHKPMFIRHITESSDELLWSRHLDENGDLMIQCESLDKMKGQFDDQILEIERIINFYKFSIQKGANEVSKIMLTGDHPYLSMVEEELAEKLEVEISRFEEGFAQTLQGELVPSRYVLPLGLSLKEV